MGWALDNAVDILVPTYNAAPWIDDFIGSLLSQDITTWRLIARDDRSSDGTVQRLEEWKARLGDRMLILPDDGLGNVRQNVGTAILLGASTAKWIMLADPDDVWLDGKMRLLMQEMRRQEAALGPHTPIAICTDARVVNGELAPLHASWWKSTFRATRHKWRPRDVAMESPALTSTMMLNRALAEHGVPIPASTVGQDWWLSLVAATVGVLVVLDQVTILYRLHGANSSGTPVSTDVGQGAIAAVTGLSAMRRRVREELNPVSVRAAEFLALHGQHLHPEELAAIKALTELPKRHALSARASIARHGLWHSSLSRNVRLFALL
jgi:rhamnosyltransferase